MSKRVVRVRSARLREPYQGVVAHPRVSGLSPCDGEPIGIEFPTVMGTREWNRVELGALALSDRVGVERAVGTGQIGVLVGEHALAGSPIRAATHA